MSAICCIVSKLGKSLWSNATEPGLGYRVAEIEWTQWAAVFTWGLFVIGAAKNRARVLTKNH